LVEALMRNACEKWVGAHGNSAPRVMKLFEVMKLVGYDPAFEKRAVVAILLVAVLITGALVFYLAARPHEVHGQRPIHGSVPTRDQVVRH